MTNRLADETSPYLRQHRDNPVDWYPWGEEAFAEARRRDVPILVSVGYSSCHWCHVMAHESFEDDATASVMNERFVNVKVDREERPDVDAVYMEAVQSLTGHGGWPMTVFVDHDGRPFFGGTYFPKTARHGLPGFVELCHAVDDAWRNRREELAEQAAEITASIARAAELRADPGVALPDRSSLDGALQQLRDRFDGEWGGFGRAPKFPQPDSIDFVLRESVHRGDASIRDMAVLTLDAMAAGGIYDHLGGGFARYSVDAFWTVPHFEKMLYDQAGLVRAYAHGWLVTGRPEWRQVLDETIAYVLRDLRHPDGGLYSAEDADSEGEEGRFYVWRRDEVRDVAGLDADAAIQWFGLAQNPNFEGAYILRRPLGAPLVRPDDVERARAALFEARTHRVRPGLDDKVLTEWNALFVAALAEAGAATGTGAWLDAAERTGEFLWANLRRPDGRWLRSWQADGGARHLAYAADHAALVDAYTRLGEATGRATWFDRATEVADALLGTFHDTERGGFFTTGHDAERLVARSKDVIDNATPSANSLGAVALLRLSILTDETRFRDAAEEVLRLLAAPLAQHPSAFANLLQAVDLVARGSREVVVAGDRPDLVRTVHDRFLPDAVVAWGDRRPWPLWTGREDGRAYVCEGYACRTPVTTAEELAAQLR